MQNRHSIIPLCLFTVSYSLLISGCLVFFTQMLPRRLAAIR